MGHHQDRSLRAPEPVLPKTIKAVEQTPPSDPFLYPIPVEIKITPIKRAGKSQPFLK
jgi:hypothetical protein